MAFRTYIPRPPLSEFVELFWSQEDYEPPHPIERVVPTGTMQLILDLCEDDLRVYERRDLRRFRGLGGSLISGARSRFVVIDTASAASTVGVHFKAGGAHPFLGVSVGELRDTDVPLEAVWGTKAAELRDRMREARTPEARFRLLERTLQARVARPPARHPAVAFALEELQNAPRMKSVRVVGERTGLSHRRFVELFRREVGLTPKLFCRALRFREAIRLIGGGKLELAEVALRCGYFDQAHFTRDFREFSGTTPTGYLARRGEHANHVPL